MTSIKKDAGFALACILLSIWITWESFSYSYQSSVLLRGLAMILVVMSVALFVIRLYQYLRMAKAAGHTASFLEGNDVRHLLKSLLVFGLVGGYILAITLVGFLFATFLFVFISMCCFSGKPRVFFLAYSAALALVIFMLFFNALGVTLPDSLLPFDTFFKIV